MMTYRMMSALCLVAGVAFSAIADESEQPVQVEYFVDCTRSDNTGDGKSEATAFRTIQAACDAAADGDMVTVLPGVYNEGGKDAYGCQTRVFVEKPLYIRSRDGKDSTHIVGAFHSNENPLGSGAVRCVAFKQGMLAGAVLEGFTIRNGATRCDNDYADIASNQGGGVYHDRTIAFSSYSPFVVDCVISNCVATRGGGTYRGGTFVRCRITDCRATNNGAALREVSLANSVVDNCDSTSIPALLSCLGAVNCTLVNCTSMGGSENRPCLNTILLYGQYDGKNASTEWTYTNCYVVAPGCGGTNNVCQTLLPSPIAAAPLDDFRLVAGTPAVGAGDAALLSRIPDVPSTVPASVCDRDNYRAFDYFGAPRTTDGGVSIGAAETAVTMAGCLRVRIQTESEADYGGVLFVNDRRCNVGIGRVGYLLYAYYWYETYPTLYKITSEAISGKALYEYQVSPGTFDPPNRNGEYWFLPKASATDTQVKGLFAKAFYADPDASADGADGTAERPFRRLQDACDYIATHYSGTNAVVLCAEGDYNEGGATLAGNNRLRMSVGQKMVFRATGDRAQTFISGENDTSDSAVNGCGPGAVRCVAMESSSGTGSELTVQGFTLRNGRSAHADTSANEGCGGGALNSSGYGNLRIVDCILTNCVASRGGAVFGGGRASGYLARSTVIDCGIAQSTGNAIVRTVTLDSCLLTGNRGTITPIGMQTSAYFCTVVGSPNRPVANIHNDASMVSVGCIFDTVGVVSSSPQYTGSLVHDYTGTMPDVDGITAADPLFVKRSQGDYRVSTESPALGLCSVAARASSAAMDLDGNPYRLLTTADGQVVATAGCYQTPVLLPVATVMILR